MPIIDVENSKQLEFGYGDIKIAGGLLKDEDECIGTVVFYQDGETQPIGTHNTFDEPRELDLENTPVRMTFEKVESIDVVIRALEDAKRYMVNGKVDCK